MEMQRDWERIIAETSAVAIPITAQPGEKEDWIRYSDSNEGEPGYYRDYLDPKTGAILYSFGETCCVHPWLCDPASQYLLRSSKQILARFQMQSC